MDNMKKHINKTDLCLIKKSKQGNENAITCLIKRYQHVVRYKAQRYAHHLNDLDDFIQEGLIALYEAVFDFKKEKEATFPTFIEICIDRKLTSYIRKQTTTKTNLLSKATSIDEPSLLTDRLITPANKLPEQLLLKKVKLLEMKKYIFKSLSLKERAVVLAYLEGDSLTEISIKLNKSYKSVDNALQRSIKKLRKCIANNFASRCD